MRKLIWLVVALAALSLTACGGSSSSSGKKLDEDMVGSWFHYSDEDFEVALGDDGSYRVERPDSGMPRAAGIAPQETPYCEEEGTWSANGTKVTLTVKETDCFDTEVGDKETMAYSKYVVDGVPMFELDTGDEVIDFTKSLLAPPDTEWMGLDGVLQWSASNGLSPVIQFLFSYDGSVKAYYDESHSCYASGTFVDRGMWLEFTVTDQVTDGCTGGIESNVPAVGTVTDHYMRLAFDVLYLCPTDEECLDPARYDANLF